MNKKKIQLWHESINEFFKNVPFGLIFSLPIIHAVYSSIKVRGFNCILFIFTVLIDSCVLLFIILLMTYNEASNIYEELEGDEYF